MNRRPQPSDFGLSPLADNVDSLTQRQQQRVRISRIRHGIGGGMRFSDESELARAFPSRFSSDFMGRRLSLTGARVAFGVYCTILLTVLLVMHVHLRFQIHDMKMQAHLLQTAQRSLDRRMSSLDRGVAHRMGDLAPLREIAVSKLQMVPNERQLELPIISQVSQKYSEESVAMATQDQAKAVAELNRVSLRKNPFVRLADIAMALTPRNP